MLGARGKVRKFGKNLLANCWRACSRLYRNECLQENIRLTAIFKLTRCAHFCNAPNSILKAKNGLRTQQKSSKFRECSKFIFFLFCKSCKFCRMLPNSKFQNFQVCYSTTNFAEDRSIDRLIDLIAFQSNCVGK